MSVDWKEQPRTGHARFENATTQPLRTERLFNNVEKLVEGWYPLCRASDLKTGEARSFVILKQRVVVWRGEDGELRALDAFCPHMGADLGNGQVVGNDIRCYFHHWTFSQDGEPVSLPCTKKPSSGIKLNRYPVAEHFGHAWIYAGETVRTPLIVPPGLEGEDTHVVRIAAPKLFAHHHVMMAGGIDLQHFATVHRLDIDFDFDHQSHGSYVYDWRMSGPIAPTGWRAKLGRRLVGPRLSYRMRVGGGSMAAISYGEGHRLFGRLLRLPILHVAWGCLPLADGVSRVEVFSVAKKRRGPLGWLTTWATHGLTLALIAFLRDDDVKAFPNMRYQIGHAMPEDKPVLQLIHAINQMPESTWTRNAEPQPVPFKDSHSTIGF